MLKQTIVVGVDPAPSKGLCVYAFDPRASNPKGKQVKNSGFAPYYNNTSLADFQRVLNTLAKDRCVLICWDAPLTMPGNFTERKIETLFKPRKPKDKDTEQWEKLKSGMASVQGAAQCSHWCITQKTLGYPSFDNMQLSVGDPSIKVNLIFKKSDIQDQENGLYLTEVHPALALQIAIGCDSIQAFGPGGELSGDGSYKKVKWTSKGPSNPAMCKGFKKLLSSTMDKFGPQDTTLDTIFPTNVTDRKKSHNLDPSDHLDAWVAMRLGQLWLDGDTVKLFGNDKDGSFLLPVFKDTREFNAINKGLSADKKLRQQLSDYQAMIKSLIPSTHNNLT